MLATNCDEIAAATAPIMRITSLELHKLDLFGLKDG
jgi:hypothetical protein